MPGNKKNRISIPPGIAAKALFLSDRTCCVCRVKGKPVQIHHVDSDPSNNDLRNLAVLCFDCHCETQVKGGFHRKLDAEQVFLYRDDWFAAVSRVRAIMPVHALDSTGLNEPWELELATSIAEILREREEYELLALHYLGIGNDELRDKYVELAVSQGMDDSTLIFFRSEQRRLDLVPIEVIQRCIDEHKRRDDWLGLGRLYRQLGRYPEAVRATCRGATEAIAKGNIFSAAFYLKEMYEDGGIEHLFMQAFSKAEADNDLWWQYRCLQELGWHSEAREFLLRHQDEIQDTEDPSWLEELTQALGDDRRYVDLKIEEARAISARPDSHK